MVEATILARLRDAVSEDGPGPFHHFGRLFFGKVANSKKSAGFALN
jgi:hypothetical protein